MRQKNPCAGSAVLCVLSAAALVACGNSRQDVDPATPTTADGAGQTSPSTTDAPADPASGFDLAALPISTAVIGDFPYLQAPEGYTYRTKAGSDLDRVAFWTGQRLEWVEGRVFGTDVVAADENAKPFSLLEYQRGMQAAIVAAGGRSIASGMIPATLRDEIKERDPDLAVRYNAGLGDIWNRPVETFVIRREDRAIWVQLTGYEYGGNLLVAETAPMQ